MKMAGNDMNKHSRTSKVQINCYLALVESHPQIKLNKNDPTHPRRIEELWAELSEQLNALKGPIRTNVKWKEYLNHWKNQIRPRAIKSKANHLATGGGPLTEVDVSEGEHRALDTIDSFVVLGAQDIPTIGTEGRDNLKLPLVIMGIVSMIGGLTSLRLPETLHQRLPQTLEEGEQFGQEWSFNTCMRCYPKQKIISPIGSYEDMDILPSKMENEANQAGRQPVNLSQRHSMKRLVRQMSVMDTQKNIDGTMQLTHWI